MPKRAGKRAPGSPAKKTTGRGSQRGAGKRAKPKETTSGPKRVKKAGAKGGKKPAKKVGQRPRSEQGRQAPSRKRPARRPRPAAAPTAPHPEGDRLQKLLAAAGLASRRECETLISEGRVQVDGQVVTELGVRVDPTRQAIHVDGEALRQPKRVYYAVNKPTGVVCTARDPSGRQRVTDLLPPSVGRVFNVGRLDMGSEGLIIVTNDGELANKLTHPRHGVEKLYQVQVAGRPTAEALAEVRRGVYLDEGRVAFANVKIKSHRKSSTILEVTLDEGRNREIRRVLARVGHKVQKLQRVAVGPVKLGEMPPGAYRQLTREEVAALRESTRPGAKSKPTPEKKAVGQKPAAKKPRAKKPDGANSKSKPPKTTKSKSPPNSAHEKSAHENKPPGDRRVIGAD